MSPRAERSLFLPDLLPPLACVIRRVFQLLLRFKMGTSFNFSLSVWSRYLATPAGDFADNQPSRVSLSLKVGSIRRAVNPGNRLSPMSPCPDPLDHYQGVHVLQPMPSQFRSLTTTIGTIRWNWTMLSATNLRQRNCARREWSGRRNIQFCPKRVRRPSYYETGFFRFLWGSHNWRVIA